LRHHGDLTPGNVHKRGDDDDDDDDKVFANNKDPMTGKH
jgi:hypothetical protein